MANTTTYPTIRASYVAAIEALTPAIRSEVPYRIDTGDELFEEFSAQPGAFRSFEFRLEGRESESLSGNLELIDDEVIVRIAYPAMNDTYDLEEVISSDLETVRGEINKTSNLVSGQFYALAEIGQTIELPNATIAEIPVELRYYSQRTA